MIGNRSVRLRRWSLALGGSVLAMAAASAASAQCAPDPTVAGGTTICTGADTNGLTSSADQASIVVAAGASLSAAPGTAALTLVPAAGSFQIVKALNVNGSITGGSAPGILLQGGSSASFQTTQLVATVGQGGSITGSNAILLSPGSAQAIATLTNSGTITGTAGQALIAGDPSRSAFSTVSNLAGGFIGGIAGNVGTLTNAGTIDGGTDSAYRTYAGSTSLVYLSTLTNSGTMRSAGTASTLQFPVSPAIANSGIIINGGSGTAIAGAILNITNNAGGTISTTGTTAIAGTGYLSLINSGIVNGSISVVTDTASTFGSVIGSFIDSTSGSINGNVTLGYADDTVAANYSAGQLDTGISGTLDPGAGANTFRVKFASSATLAALALPTGFQNLQFALVGGSTVTLAPGFAVARTLTFDGSGTLVNNAALAGAGRIISHYFTDVGSSTGGNGVSFTNSGSITSTLGAYDTEYAVRLTDAAGFINSGTITATGGLVQPRGGAGAVELSEVPNSSNSGTITADQYAVDVWFGSFTNTGTLRSTAGTALHLSDSVLSGYFSFNQGLIEGAQAGVLLSDSLANDGVIQSPQTAVLLASDSKLYNRATGTITGPVAVGPGTGTAAFNSTVINAGTINGNVNFGQSSGTSGNGFFALPGSVLNGNLVLGSGYDLFVTSLTNNGPGLFAGVTGIVSGAGPETIRYLVTADGSGTISPLAPFTVVGYDLANNAALTLTAPAAVSVPLLLSGVGSIDLTANIALANQTLIQSTGPVTLPGIPSASAVSTQLAVISRGTLAASFTNNYGSPAITLGADTFTNAGTLQISSKAFEATGISGGTSVVNSGTILLDRAVAISGATSVVNSGTIGQASGSTSGRGVVGNIRLINSGTIATIGNAVELTYNSNANNPLSLIDNSGTISSTNGAAITAPFTFSSGFQLINRASGTISGGTSGTAIALGSGWTVLNSGTINGNVTLAAYASDSYSTTYSGVDGVLNGNLTFGGGADYLVVQDGVTGVTGQIDGGAGNDTVIRRATTSGTITLGGALPTNFEREAVEALGTDTVVNVAGSGSALATPLSFFGDGAIVNDVSVAVATPIDSAYINATNAVTLSGRIDGIPGALTFTNNASLQDGLQGFASSLTNNGTISTTNFGYAAVTLSQGIAQPDLHAISVTNTGTIAADEAGADGLFVSTYRSSPATAANDPPSSITVVNSGTISAGSDTTAVYSYQYQPPSITVALSGSTAASLSITNQKSGVIAATGNGAIAISVSGGTGSTFILNNAGQITAPATAPAPTYPFYYQYVPAAITANGVTSQIHNTGTITGAIYLGDGDDTIENRGTITGNVFMGAGNDTFVQLAGTVTGTVDGGAGLDSLTIDTTNSGTVDASQFVNFELFTQAGSGDATYTGAFTAQSFGISGGSLTVAPGASLTSTDPVTITGSNAGEQVTNAGTISGSIALGGGNDSVINRGTIGGAVALGDGDDSFTEGAGSSVAGGVDGGTGTNTYVAELAGDRTGLAQRTNFQTLGVTGTGTLTLTLDQSWQNVMLAGTNLNVTLAGFAIGAVTGGDGAEQFTADGDIGSAALGGGDDVLSLRTNTLAGAYDGGTGSNTLHATAGGPVTLSGSVSNFSLLDLAGGALTITGTLANAQGVTTLAGTDHSVSIARGANVSGGFSLGAGTNSLRVLAGSTVTASITGSDGTTPASIDLINDGGSFAFAGNLAGFGPARISGGGTVELDGAFAASSTSFDGNLTIGAAGSLTSPTVTGSAATSTVTIAGAFTGAMDLGTGNTTLRLTGAPTIAGSIIGGGGTDAIELAVSGTDAAPTSFGTNAAFTGFATLRTTAGVASFAGTRSFASSIEVGAGSRLIGQVGSVFTAPRINVAAGGTFGSAGTVNGNVAVAGTLSPGASPGTMTVNGNVALATGSTSLFELTTGVSDKLLVSGMLTIASGATLNLVGTRPLTPGVTLDLIVANGGISGSFATVNQPSSIGGFLSQTADTLSLLGTFQTSAKFLPQVNRAIDGVNGLLISGQASAAVLASVPQLLTGGAANAQAFAQISPEPYASALALGTENGLSLIDAVRGQTRSAPTSTGLYAFAQGLGYRYTMRGDASQGTNGARLSATGGIAGVGFGTGIATVGAFVGYGDDHQRIDALGSKLNGHGLLAGIQGDVTFAGLKLTALAAYDNTHAHLDRIAPQGNATSGFGLHSEIGDLVARYSIMLTPGVKLQPRIGVSYIHTDRGAASEAGSSPYKLDLPSQSGSRWFIDGGADIAGAIGPVHAFAGLGVRRRLSDADTSAIATFAGTTSSIVGLAITPERTAVLGTIGGSIDLTPALSLSASYTGAFAHTTRNSATIGLRLAM